MLSTHHSALASCSEALSTLEHNNRAKGKVEAAPCVAAALAMVIGGKVNQAVMLCYQVCLHTRSHEQVQRELLECLLVGSFTVAVRICIQGCDMLMESLLRFCMGVMVSVLGYGSGVGSMIWPTVGGDRAVRKWNW